MNWHRNDENTIGLTWWRTPRILVLSLGRRALYVRL